MREIEEFEDPAVGVSPKLQLPLKVNVRSVSKDGQSDEYTLFYPLEKKKQDYDRSLMDILLEVLLEWRRRQGLRDGDEDGPERPRLGRVVPPRAERGDDARGAADGEPVPLRELRARGERLWSGE